MSQRPIGLSLGILLLMVGTSAAQKSPADALKTMVPGEGLQVELFAAEPMLVNPTAIDVDHQGRVWVAEAMNYRRKNFGRPILRPEGDRIQVLIDETGDGKATKAVTFYQGPELYGPLSVLVLPQADGKKLRVLVAQSPDILEFTCKDASNPVADGPPKKFLTGFGGFDHDHGVHGLTVGPDSKLYFTVGDSGVKDLQSSDGKGKKWSSNSTDCRAGTVWRCDLDGKNVELIAHNFRNNYEACVDSFGEIWLSDNDDDGNQQTRICFVLPGGNYGYHPRGAGQSHWHEEQPGIVHKALRTGFGSPTGICFYEGTLLPKQYQGDLIHCDAGPREVRYFKRKPKGAGYELDKINMLTSTDNWFRPSDCCVAPDGSLMVADWYDPGVGGHGMGDWTRGRIYRLTPKGHKGYKVPEVKLDTKEGIKASLTSPNGGIRHIANEKLNSMEGKAALPIVVDAITGTEAVQARCFRQTFLIMRRSDPSIVTSEMQQTLGAWQTKLMKSREFMAMLVRCSAEYGLMQEPPSVQEASKPEMIGATREFLLAIRNAPATAVKPIVENMLKVYDGQDIFYRAALNIACGTDPARRDAILADFEKHFPEWNDKVADLVWELRPKSMLPKMGLLLEDAKLSPAQKARIVDILAVNDDAAAGKSMLTLLKGNAADEVKAKAIDNLRLYLPTKWNALARSEELKATISDLLKSEKNIIPGLLLVAAANDARSLDEVIRIAGNGTLPTRTREEAVATLGKIPSTKSVEALKSLLDDKVLAKSAAIALGNQITGNAQSAPAQQALAILQGIVTGPAGNDLKSLAITALTGSRTGTAWLIALKERGGFPESLLADAGRLLRNSPFQGERNKAMLLFPAPGKLDPKKLPAASVLAQRQGNAQRGEAVFKASLKGDAQCMRCHMVRGLGGNIGPDLSMIGKKASKENLYDSILTPSKAIADQYVQWKVDTSGGKSITGLLVAENETSLTLRDANGKDYVVAIRDLDGPKTKSLVSIMPDNLVAALTEDELIDLVEYMMTLKTASYSPESWHIMGPFANDSNDSALDRDLGLESLKNKLAISKQLPGKEGNVAWNRVRMNGAGYIDLTEHYAGKSTNSASYLLQTVESPVDQDATILFGNDDGAKIWLNDTKVFENRDHFAATPERHRIAVKLKKGSNEILIKIVNGNDPHGFYFALTSEQELKAGK